jgi:sugar fermentation stimulation protein A
MKRSGAYILLFRLQQDEKIEVGRLGVVPLRRGEYAYVGSAMGGLDARIARHLRAEKKRHWHIDYVLERASISGVLEFESASRVECRLSDALASSAASTTPVRWFGSSDCRSWGGKTSCGPAVLVLQPAEHRLADDALPGLSGRTRTTFGGVEGPRAVRSHRVVVLDIPAEHAPQVSLVTAMT